MGNEKRSKFCPFAAQKKAVILQRNKIALSCQKVKFRELNTSRH